MGRSIKKSLKQDQERACFGEFFYLLQLMRKKA